MNLQSESISFFISLLILCVSNAAKLPEYFKQCSLSDPELNKCMAEHANLAIPRMVQGDKSIKLVNLNPLLIDEVKISPGANLELKLNKLKVYGLGTTKVNEAIVSKDALHLEFKVFIPTVELVGEYEINGRILVLPIEGKGPANITIVNGNFDYTLDLELFEKNGVKYAKVKDHGMKYISERAIFKLDNLFNGNQALSDQMNAFLNENTQEVGREFGPSVSETVGIIITSIVSSVIGNVAWNDILLP